MTEKKRLSIFGKYLTCRELLCIGAGIALGKLAPETAARLDALAIYTQRVHQL